MMGLANGVSPRTKDRAFELIGGHPALDLVNTLDWRFRSEPPPEELLTDYEDLARFSAQSGLVSDAQARRLIRNVSEGKAKQVVGAVREMREAAAQSFVFRSGGRRSSGIVNQSVRSVLQSSEGITAIVVGWCEARVGVEPVPCPGGVAALDAFAEYCGTPHVRGYAQAARMRKS